MRHTLCTLLAVLLGTAELAAQGCKPFKRWGMRPIWWTAGSTLELGSTESGDAAIALRFRHDESLGVVMTSIGHRSTNAGGQVSVHDFPAEPTADKALWKAVFRPLSSQDPIEVFPDCASWVSVWVDDRHAPRKAIFSWYGLDLPGHGGCGSIFWMEMSVEIGCEQPDRSEWSSRLGRIQLPFGGGEPVTLDEVHAPIVHVQQPGPATRLLVPIAGAFVLPATNMPMGFWAFNPVTGQPITLEVEHPARGQQMQFSAMYSHNLGTPSFRKIVYFATEDSEGYYKRFCHAVTPDVGGAFYRWDAVHFPVYGPSPHVNFHRTEYVAVVSALEACTDSFWYDVTDRYRDFVDREMGLERIASPDYALNPDFVSGSTFVATSINRPPVVDEAQQPAVYDSFLAQARNMEAWFTGADGQPTPTFMEWQKWLKGGVDAPLGPEDPIGPNYNPRPFSGAEASLKEPTLFVREAIDSVRAAGINLSVYTLPVMVNNDDWPSWDPTWYLRERDGSIVGASGVEGAFADYGYTEVPQWFADNIYDDIMDTSPSLGGVFFDVLSGGGGSFLRYPADPGLLFKKRYHGGKRFSEGVQRVFDLVRDRIAAGKPTTAHPDIPFIPTETVQEFLAGRYDFAQHGLKPVPGQMQLNVLFDLFGGFPVGLSAEVSNPSPPLWNAVYHDYSRAEGLTVQLSTRATQFGDVSFQRWGDYMRMVHALWWFQGMKPMSFQYLLDNQGWELIVEDNGTVGPRDPAIPQQGQLLDFLLRMHQSLDRECEAGQFLNSGRMERPLQMPNAYFAQSIDPFTPSFAIRTSLAVLLANAPGVLHFYENPFTTGEINALLLGQPGYPMPQVLQGVWRSAGPDPKLGIVFVNWSDAAAFWQGIFDPRCYDGFGDGFAVVGLRPDGAGVEEYPVGDGVGPTQLYWGIGPGLALQHHGQAAPGFMPPRSIQVFLIEPR